MIFPSTLTTINSYAFSESGLQSVTIPATVTTIGSYAFEGCGALTSIDVADENTAYSDDDGVLFNKDQTKLMQYPASRAKTEYTVPSTATSVENRAFQGSKTIVSVDLGSVTTLGNNAFSECSSLTTVDLGSVTTVDGYDFWCCTSLATVDLSSVTSIGDHAFQNCKSLTSVDLSSATSIGYRAFSGCTGLNSATLCEDLVMIDSYTFQNCSALTSIEIPKSVSSIAVDAFEGCDALASITVAEGNQNYSHKDGVLFNSDKTNLILYPAGKTDTLYNVPSGVTSLGSYAFSGSRFLTTVNLGSVESTGYYVFEGCSALTRVDLGSLKSVNDYAFQDCTFLKEVNFGSVTTLGWSSFFGCISLDSVEFPSTLTTIGSSAFCDCISLESVAFPVSVTTINNYAFSGCSSLGSVDLGSVQKIGYNAFEYCTILTTVTIPASVTLINDDAFFGCTSLTGITVDAGNNVYCDDGGVLFNKNGKNILYLYPSMKDGSTYTVPASVTQIESGAFYKCIRLTSIGTDSTTFCSVDGVLYNAAKSELVAYPAGKTDESYTMPDTLEDIGSVVFCGCDSLKRIVLPDSLELDNDLILALAACPALETAVANEMTPMT